MDDAGQLTAVEHGIDARSDVFVQVSDPAHVAQPGSSRSTAAPAGPSSQGASSPSREGTHGRSRSGSGSQASERRAGLGRSGIQSAGQQPPDGGPRARAELGQRGQR